VVLLAVAQGLERWEARVPGVRVGPVHDALQTFALLGFTGALLAFGSLWPGLSIWLRIPFVAAGALGIAAAGHMGLRRLSGLGGPYSLVATREGLVERSRAGALLHPWETVLVCSLGELAGNACVRIEIDDSDPAACQVLRTRPGLSPEKLVQMRQAAHASNRKWVGFALFALRDQVAGRPGALHRQVSAVLDGTPGAAEVLPPAAEVLE
jgi:hypothetical protein